MPTPDPQDVVVELRRRVATLGSGPIAAAIAGAARLNLLWSTWLTVQPEETSIVSSWHDQKNHAC